MNRRWTYRDHARKVVETLYALQEAAIAFEAERVRSGTTRWLIQQKRAELADRALDYSAAVRGKERRR